LLIDTQAKQTHKARRPAPPRDKKRRAEERRKVGVEVGANKLLTNATNEGESFWGTLMRDERSKTHERKKKNETTNGETERENGCHMNRVGTMKGGGALSGDRQI
jgi:hypothetical protein